MTYLTPEQVLFIHSRLIDNTGGAHGLRDLGLLLSAMSRPKATFEGKDLYPDLFHKAAALFESLVNNHPFIDGNKRTAIVAAGLFLRMNGHVLETSQRELERFTLNMATGRTTLEDAAKWFEKYGV
ncbi:MAG: type II toxin-antitoxin system death-on-curing family toxin [Nitrospirae bacterium]|nr:type II toxin-antitoxin system death-on-curing family toxin [Nitrospirota bacterium]